jgi:hypothetical protein
MGADLNADDYLAYRTDRATSSNIFYFDGIGPGTAAFVSTGAQHVDNQWQHHRIQFDTAAQKCAIYIDDMVTPVVASGDLARPDVAVPTRIILRHEGNSADDGYCAIDDVSFTVDGTLVNLATTFTDGFESYPVRTSADDDADPRGAWITVESDGTGSGRSLAPAKVQVVGVSVVTPHSGSKCLKLEAGQRAGASIAWGAPPQTDVQITWWARVPAAVVGPSPDAVYLRMSLYGTEGGSSYSGDSALLGYGIRAVAPPVGDATSLTYFTTVWQDTTKDYTPDVWEEYRLTTHNSQGRYTIIKNPRSASPEVVVDRAGFIGSALNWGPTFMAAWSSSNGTNHPPVYIDDIEIKSLVSNSEPLPNPYTTTFHGTRFTNMTVLNIGGPVGKAVFDPRDNSTILFTLDAASPGGGIYRARKTASGNWSVDPQPLVTGIDRPSGLTVGADGTIWWVHDFAMSLRRLKEPWASSAYEEVVSNFGYADTDDDSIDVCIAPASFNGSIGKPNFVIVGDRGSDGDAFNTVYVVDPATTTLNQGYQTNGVAPPAGWWQFLVQPTTSGLGSDNINTVAPLPQSGEIVTVTTDGYISAINAAGAIRNIFPATLWQDIFTGGPAPRAVAVAADPTSGRLWVADDTRDEVWSLDPNPATQNAAPDQKELSFPLTNPGRPDLQLQVHDPSMAFSGNGAYMVLTDTSVANGGGRLLIFHNEVPAFPITSANVTPQGFELNWQSAGSGAKYRVQRSGTLANFQDISGDLTGTQFTDTNSITGQSFYRVVVQP